MKVAVIQFPGSNCDLDTLYILNLITKTNADLVWHNCNNLQAYDCVVLPGGFSYGDRLRAGIIAAYSPIMREVKQLAKEGKPVLGICNGFQVLVEAGLLPGALLKNSSLKFICKWVSISVLNTKTAFTGKCKKSQILTMPIAHIEGRYFIEKDQLEDLYAKGQVVLKYVDEKGEPTRTSNPNGSIDNIAGISNEKGNVLGLMPHPERSSEKILNPIGSNDGSLIFESMIEHQIRGLNLA